MKIWLNIALAHSIVWLAAGNGFAQQLENGDTKFDSYRLPKLKVGKHDWPQWGGTSLRNNAPRGRGIPIEWDTETGKNIKWSTQLGSQTFGSPIVANGRIFIGTNNGAGLIKRFPAITFDLGCLVCLDECTGKFQWQYSVKKLETGRVQDWPYQGLVSTPVVDGERLWVVTNRGEVVCLDTLGFQDEQNDGPFTAESVRADDEADVVWKFDMIGKLGISPHNMCTCSCTFAGDALFVVTGNGVDESHINLPAPTAPAFIALNRRTGELIWKDNSPGAAVMHGSWSSPAYAVLGGRPQVLFPGGDGWLYSFDPAGDGQGGSKLLWEFDCNTKHSQYVLGGRGNRCEYITVPVIYDGKVYVAIGQDVEHGEGPGHLWCIDPTRRMDGTDISPTRLRGRTGHARTRREAVSGFSGELIQPNPDSAVVWDYAGQDHNTDGKLSFDERINRSCAQPAIADGLLFLSDHSGMLHCMDAATGKYHWNYDLFAATWVSAPLIVDQKVYACDEDGDVAVFELSSNRKLLAENYMGNSVYSSPCVAGNTLYVGVKNRLFAIESTDAK